CIPGGGWEIRSLETADIEIPGGLGSAIKVNRAIIQNGTIRQLVYYWFEQRGRRLTSEYMVKWHILWDGVLRNRTDGSLVRLITPILDEGAERAADKRLTELLGPIYHVLPRFLPQ
ncbi:MAG: EpsI family protein, partial [Rhodospirillales bacterium]|nr:EpsI family protein [Rhodospirillales bacterium]